MSTRGYDARGAASAGGFVKLPRGALESAAFSSPSREAYCSRAAWTWLVAHARWRPGIAAAAGCAIPLEAGQLSFSLRYMATAWGWQEPRVRRLLARLEKHGLIVASTDGPQTVVTICDYTALGEESGSADASNDARTTRRRRSSDAKEKMGEDGGRAKMADSSIEESAAAESQTRPVEVPPAPRQRPSRARQPALMLPLPGGNAAAAQVPEAPPDQLLRSAAWAEMRAILGRLKPALSRDRMGALVGQWVQTVGGNPVIVSHILRDAERAAADARIAGDPVAWIAAAVKNRAQSPNGVAGNGPSAVISGDRRSVGAPDTDAIGIAILAAVPGLAGELETDRYPVELRAGGSRSGC